MNWIKDAITLTVNQNGGSTKAVSFLVVVFSFRALTGYCRDEFKDIKHLAGEGLDYD